LEASGQELTKPRLQSEARTAKSPTPKTSCGCKFRERLVADAAARIMFENIDKENFLQIVAPVDAVITDVTSPQPGDNIQANAPLGGIALKNARPILKIEIAKQDRAFLRERLPVQLKFKAFSYQRYGLLRDTLQFISPATRLPSRRCRPCSPCMEGALRWNRNRISTRWAKRFIRCVIG
jgi:hemolysin D